MLPREHRLLLKNQWTKIRKEGKMFSGTLFSLIIETTTGLAKDQKPAQFGFIVSTKISKKATVRNRIKRLLRESVRSFLPDIPANTTVVVLVKRAAVDKGLGSIKEEMARLFK